VLLAGGASRRFGGFPKGLAIVKEIRIADRALIALKGATDAQVVVSNDGAAEEWFPSLPVVADAVPGLGPLAGIATGLRAAKGAAVIVLAWDMPFVTAPLLRGMRALGELDGAAVIPVHGSGQIAEPLCAYYPPEALETCLRLLEAGERRAGSLVEALPSAVSIPERLLTEHGDLERLFMSVDSPEQLAAIGGEMPAPRR
jgi:molybdopterin-guanine dinucleotide biosynthesis protein A